MRRPKYEFRTLVRAFRETPQQFNDRMNALGLLGWKMLPDTYRMNQANSSGSVVFEREIFD